MTMATFYASLPHIGGAIKLHGEGGLRLTLDVSESDVPEALQLALMRGKNLLVTVSIADERVPFDEPDDRKVQAEDARARLTIVEDEIPF